MKALITGANGQVGKELVIAAQQRSIAYMACDRSQLDITNITSINTVVDTYNPDVVINAAAYTVVDAAEDNVDEAYNINRDGVENLALACRRKDIPLLHISTDFVFDGNKIGAYAEEDIPNPVSVYGKSKLAGEEILRKTWEKHIIFRTSWVYSVHGSNFVKTMLRLMNERSEIQVIDDQWGCPTSAQTIALALFDVAIALIKDENKAWGTYHYCEEGRTNWCEFSREILRQAKQFSTIDVSILPIKSDQWVSAAERPKNSELSSKKIKEIFGVAGRSWSQQLKPIIEYLCDA